MARTIYNQPQTSVAQQISMLKSNGLRFDDEIHAQHLLNHISLFRIKSYLKPLRQIGSRQFKQNSTFEEAFSLYKFDSELRKLVASELEKIEISFRTQLTQIIGKASGVYWFCDSTNFTNQTVHTKILEKISNEVQRSDDDLLIRFQSQYCNPFPPCWITFEECSFGSISHLYKYFNPGVIKRDVAKYYGIADKVFESWMHALVYVRNICAHHSRLWNRKLSINALVPRKTQRQFVSRPADTKRIYYVLSIIIYLLKVINPASTFVTKLKSLLSRYKNVDVAAMGFPSNWEQEPLWQT